MPDTPPKTNRRQSSLAMLLSVVLALVITAASFLAFIVWVTTNIDQRAVERQRTLVTHIIDGRQKSLLQQLESVAVWDDAVVNTQFRINFDWIADNLGVWMYDFYRIDRIAIFDKNAVPIYLMDAGVSLEPAEHPELTTVFAPFLGRLRSFPPTHLPPGMSTPVGLTDLAIIAGQPAMVAAMPIVTHSGALPQLKGAEPVVLALEFLDDAAADKINGEYLIENGRFSLVESNDPSGAAHPIENAAGRFIGFFEWDSDHPGTLMLRQTAPALAIVFTIGAFLACLLLRRLRGTAIALEAEHQLVEHQAVHDKLTNLPNRMGFDARLAAAIADSQIRKTQLTLFMLDLDRFKQVNDTLGHQVGDELIGAVSDRLHTVFGADAIIARLGGDEFAILTANHDELDDVLALSARVIEAIGRPFLLNRAKAHVGASIGIVRARGDDAEPSELFRKADIALYEAKAGGRNRAVVYEEHMNELLQLQHTIEGELREALGRDDQLSVVFQPLIDQSSRKVIGAEALVRWHHPKYGQIAPGRFISVAESTGLIEVLGEFVLRRACQLGATVPGRTIAVNVSPMQLRNPRFPNLVFDILHQTGMRAVDLELEITESILLDEEHISAQNLRAFRTAGIQIALDDFGTGYSSLSYLKRYPVDRIKIDRSFVSQLADGHVSVAITDAIVTLAHAMELEVTAEGVETEEQATILGRLGCNTLQGFLFSAGVSADEITAMFKAPENAALTRRQRRRPPPSA